jgi:hypothetical protein
VTTTKPAVPPSAFSTNRWALVLSIIAVLFSFITLVVATTKHDTPTSNAANEEVRGLPSGYDDVALYTSASEKLVGALWLESFSSASAHGSSGESLVGHGLPAPEALCNCACFAESNFVYCQVRSGREYLCNPLEPNRPTNQLTNPTTNPPTNQLNNPTTNPPTPT